MSWYRLVIAFELKSPMHVGFLPNQSGTVTSRTRCYVPGKNLWGAVVSSMTPCLFSNPDAGAFNRIGDVVRSDVAFSYFYFADEEEIFTPHYQEQKGMMLGSLTEQEFRSRHIAAYVSTKLDKSGGAEFGSLHEIEFIRDKVNSGYAAAQRLLLAGVVWFKQGAVIEGKDLCEDGETITVEGRDIFSRLTIGGERNYGFGLVERTTIPNNLHTKLSELWSQPDPYMPQLLNGDALLSHVPYKPEVNFKGDVELIAGREYPNDLKASAYQQAGVKIEIGKNYWLSPGTYVAPESCGEVVLDSWGRLDWFA